MDLLTETTTTTRTGISWYTAPGIRPLGDFKKETLDACLIRVFNLQESELTNKRRFAEQIYAKHARRYILERILKDGRMATPDTIRINVRSGRNEKYAIWKQLSKKRDKHKRVTYWKVLIRHNNKRYKKAGFRTFDEAVIWRNIKLKELNMAFFRYSLKQIALMSGCDRCTVIYSLTTCRNLMETDRDYREKCEKVFDKLNNGLLILPK